MDARFNSSIDYVGDLAAQLGRNWPAIDSATASASEVVQLLASSLTAKFGPFADGDVDFVAFGSLARSEWTSGSDVDWTLLIDGQANPEHRTLAREIKEVISATSFRGEKLRGPGTEGIFGSLAFSHDVVHHIGGQGDSNRNTTQRILLLLESKPIRHIGHLGEVGPHERTTAQILFRYLHDDTNFIATGSTESRIPRFFLNDVVRYWRTLCVDFAYKEWEQGGGKWALRNVKLRMSRKLLFVSALLTIFSCYKNNELRVGVSGHATHLLSMQKHLLNFVGSTPANVICWTFSRLGMNSEAGAILDAYNRFLVSINDLDIRTRLESLSPSKVYDDVVFQSLRAGSHELQSELRKAFFLNDSELREFTFEYGVF